MCRRWGNPSGSSGRRRVGRPRRRRRYAVFGRFARPAPRESAIDAVSNTKQHVFDSTSAWISVQETEGRLSAQRSIRTSKPSSRLLTAAQCFLREGRDSSHAEKTVRLVRVEPFLPLPAGKSSARYMEDVDHFFGRDFVSILQIVVRAEDQSFTDAPDQVINRSNPSREGGRAAQRLDDLAGSDRHTFCHLAISLVPNGLDVKVVHQDSNQSGGAQGRSYGTNG